jgi:hypothetical protein
MLCDTQCLVQSDSQCPAKISPGNRFRAIIRRSLLRAKRLEGPTWQVTPLAGNHFGDGASKEGAGIEGDPEFLWNWRVSQPPLGQATWYDSIRLPDARITDHTPFERQFSTISTDHAPPTVCSQDTLEMELEKNTIDDKVSETTEAHSSDQIVVNSVFH